MDRLSPGKGSYQTPPEDLGEAPGESTWNRLESCDMLWQFLVVDY